MTFHSADPLQDILALCAPEAVADSALVERVMQEVQRRMSASQSPEGLYGIGETNRDANDLFSKNRVNNALPMSLCAFMQSKGLGPVLVRVTPPDSPRPIEEVEITFEEAFGTATPISECGLAFECPLESRASYYKDAQPRFDVVIDTRDGRHLGLEIKLCVTPDDKTSSKPESEWRPETVFRPNTMQNAMMSLYLAMSGKERKQVRAKAAALKIHAIRDWSRADTVTRHEHGIVAFIDFLLECFHHLQEPLVLMPVWATCAKTNFLHPKAADVFLWTNLAFVDAVRSRVGSRTTDFPRWLRALARGTDAMIALCEGGSYSYETTTAQSEGAQGDKELALDSGVLAKVLTNRRIVDRAVSAAELRFLLGQNPSFSPERRLDQVLYIESIIANAVGTTMSLGGSGVSGNKET